MLIFAKSRQRYKIYQRDKCLLFSHYQAIIQLFAIKYDIQVPFIGVKLVKKNNNEDCWYKYQLFYFNTGSKILTTITKPSNVLKNEHL